MRLLGVLAIVAPIMIGILLVYDPNLTAPWVVEGKRSDVAALMAITLATASTAVLSWLMPSEILGRLTTSTIVVAPAVIGLGFGAMVLAVVSGTGSFSRGLGWRGWRPIATGSYTLYLTHMLAIPVAQVVTESLSGGGTSLTGRWLAFLPWYLAVSAFAAFALHRLVEKPVLNWRDRYLESSESFAAVGTIRTTPTIRTT